MIKIVKFDRVKDKDKYGVKRCDECGKHFVLGQTIVNNGSWKYHLTCFKKYYTKALELLELDVVETKQILKQLEPYSKEMICESLEGVK